jgi:WD40 repeat protein
VGADLDQRLAFVLAQDRTVVALDLASGRVRTFLDSVQHVTLGPDGTLFTVNDSLEISQLHRRTPVRLGARLEAPPVATYGTRTGQLLAMSDSGDSALSVFSTGDQPPTTVAIPAGRTAATHWGDLLAVTTASGLTLYEPRASEPVRSLAMTPAPHTVAFSPSGHRLYAAGDENLLEVYDRYSDELISSIPLPGPITAIRSDPFGGWLLLRAATADSIWIVDVGGDRLIGSAATGWEADLPTIIGNALLLRQGEDVVALDLEDDAFAEQGRIADGADDVYLTVAWTPRDDDRYGDLLALDEEDEEAASATIYLQISSSRNPAWAQDLVNLMEAAGLRAGMLEPGEGEEAYRVVLGPYPTREAAEEEARTLGRPSFIYQARTATDQSADEPAP